MAQGQIEHRGERRFLIRWFQGRAGNGKRRYGSRMIHGTKREAASALRDVLRRQELGVVVESKGMPLDTYLDRWLDDTAPKKRRERTVRDYREKLKRYVRPLLGMKRIDRLSPLDVQEMIGDLERKGLSPQTIRYAHAVLSAALGQAVRWRLIQANPCRDVELPKRRPREMAALTPAQCGKLREKLVGDRLEALFLRLLGTGLRPGEALALRWEDVNLDAGWLRVERTLGRKAKGVPWSFDEPKTPKSRRTVTLPPSVTRALLAHRARQAEDRLQAGAAYGDLGLVFATPFGQPLDERNVVNRHFKPALVWAELPGAVRLYDLRHTAATLMLAGGAQVRAVADRLGHASAKMTLDVYAHTLEPQHDEATAVLEGALFGRG